MADFNLRSDSVNVEQIMEQIRTRIREKRGVDYTEQQIHELAAVKLEKFLDPKGVRSDLLDQFRKAQPAYEPPELPNFAFEESTLFESHRAPIRWMRKLLAPLLKLLFNPNPLIQALNIQSRLNAMNAEREARREAARRGLDQLYYELIHNLVLEATRTGIEVKNLKMRLESVSSRLEFNERRSRALEGAVVYKSAPEESPAPPQPQPPVQQYQQRTPPPPRQSQPSAPAPSALLVSAAVQTAAPADATTPVAGAPGAGEGPGQRSRRRRRRRGRRGGGAAAAVIGAAGAAPPAGQENTASADLAQPDDFDGPEDGDDSAEAQDIAAQGTKSAASSPAEDTPAHVSHDLMESYAPAVDPVETIAAPVAEQAEQAREVDHQHAAVPIAEAAEAANQPAVVQPPPISAAPSDHAATDATPATGEHPATGSGPADPDTNRQ
ncbi:MAG TPA: hypothetical protein VGH34_15955 [Vicinamibacterales bacterium]